MLHHRHELYLLADMIDWDGFEREFGALSSEKKGRPGIPIRLLIGLSYLSNTFNLSDQAVIEVWVENPYWQYFCGEQYFQHKLPIDPSSLSRWRKRIGPAGCERILAATVQVGLNSGAVSDWSGWHKSLTSTYGKATPGLDHES